MIIIEGPRNVGKTYLLNQNNIRYYKYSFVDIKKIIQDDNMLMGYQMGKDFNIMKLNEEGFLQNNIIIDRGFLTSLVYSFILSRGPESVLIDYIKAINYNYKKYKIVFIYGQNTNKRGPKDFLDDLPYGIQYKVYQKFLNYLPKENIIEFENKFNDQSLIDFNNLIKELI